MGKGCEKLKLLKNKNTNGRLQIFGEKVCLSILSGRKISNNISRLMIYNFKFLLTIIEEIITFYRIQFFSLNEEKIDLSK